MSTTPWHADAALIERYAGGAIDQANASSIEEHLIACASCRALATQAADVVRLEQIWTGVRAAADRPRTPFLARILVRLGMREHIARLISATPALTVSWVVAIAVTLVWPVALAHQPSASPLPFLIVAPLIPLSGIALAYGPGIDPTYDMSIAAPINSFRLYLLRAGTVLVATIGITAIASAVMPSMGWRALAWLLPALGVSFVTAALSTWLPSVVSAVAVGGGWVLLSVMTYAVKPGGVVSRFAAFEPAGQSICAIVAVAAAVLIAARAGTFEMRSNA